VTHPHPRESKTSPRRLEAHQKRARALELRKAGATFEQIAQQVGYSGRSKAYEAVQKALRDVTIDDAEEVLALELQRLDAMQMGLWGKARVGDVQAVNALLRIMDRRAKYLGLDDYESRMAAVAEQQVQVNQQLAGQIIQLMEAVLGELQLPPEQDARARGVVVQQIERLQLIASPPPAGLDPDDGEDDELEEAS
jgi:hypothetical protein